MVDFSKEQLEARDWVKVRASTDDSQSFMTWVGSVYSVEPGERKQHLFQILGMNAARCIANPEGGWDFASRELTFYLDPKTGEVLRKWKNPWTEEMLPVVHVANNGVQGNFKGPFSAIVEGETTVFVFDLFSYYPNPLADDRRFSPYSPQPIYQATELFKLTVPTAEWQNPEITSVSKTLLGWNRIGPWVPWMKMGDRPGYLVYSAWGRKVPSFSDLPPLLQEEINTRVPLYKNAPQSQSEIEHMTSWNYFKKHGSGSQVVMLAQESSDGDRNSGIQRQVK
ncbi:MAG: DUF1838 domain-containing protein [Hormoscilla sp. GUM202]|nr:DUF1838 domain-containing protein [Hormoscilla sp. GUM202]